MGVEVTAFDLSHFEAGANQAVDSVGQESVNVFVFLAEQFALGDVRTNHLFQFVFRSFYRLDNAGLTSEFKAEYFCQMEKARIPGKVDLREIVKALQQFPNHKGQESLQFSFTTKLANTVQPEFPIYDSEIAKVFGFRPPYNYLSFEERLDRYLGFYQRIRQAYLQILTVDALADARKRFRQKYAVTPSQLPETKVLDFIMWKGGKIGLCLKEEKHKVSDLHI